MKMKRFATSAFVFLLASTLCLGQGIDYRIKMVNRMAQRMMSDTTRKGPAAARFIVDVLSSGEYSMENKSYYIVYPEKATDTSRISGHASYIEKALNLQGARRTYDKNSADVLINVKYARDRSRRTIYQELKRSTYSTKNLGGFDVYRGDRYGSASGRSSIDNPNLPYYQNSFGSAGKKTYLQPVRVSNHSFSMIIEGVSLAGDTLWKTVATDFRSAAVTDAIMPYLAFASVGFLGNETDCSEQFLSDNPIYLKWSEGLLDSQNTVLYPEYNSSSPKVAVVSIIKEGERTTVVLKDRINVKKLKKSEAFIEHNGQKISASGYYIDERRVPSTNYPAITILEFPINSDNLEEFDLVFYSKKGKEKLAIRNIKPTLL